MYIKEPCSEENELSVQRHHWVCIVVVSSINHVHIYTYHGYTCVAFLRPAEPIMVPNIQEMGKI